MNLKKATDIDLIQAYLTADNQQAFNELKNRYHGIVVSLVAKYFKNENYELTYDDIVQECYIRILKYLPSYNPAKGGVSNFFYMIANHTCHNITNRDGNNHRIANTTSLQHELAENYALEETLAEDFRIAETAEAKEILTMITDRVSRMPKREREVFRLRLIEGYSYTQIAAELSISRQLIILSLSSIRKKLRNFENTFNS